MSNPGVKNSDVEREAANYAPYQDGCSCGTCVVTWSCSLGYFGRSRRNRCYITARRTAVVVIEFAIGADDCCVDDDQDDDAWFIPHRFSPDCQRRGEERIVMWKVAWYHSCTSVTSLPSICLPQVPYFGEKGVQNQPIAFFLETPTRSRYATYFPHLAKVPCVRGFSHTRRPTYGSWV